jgi:NodT family efflux transporter outer membrane factor (OMF) lipoprotein
MKYMKIYKLVLAPVVLLSLQSCFTAKTYERPKVLPEESLYRTDNVPTDTTSMANVSWQEIFTDPILQEHISNGLENNLDIRIALQNIRAAEAYVKQGKAGYLPTLGMNGSYTWLDPSESSQVGLATGGESVNQYDLTASLSWEADIWGKIRSQKRAFVANYLQSLAAHKAVKTELIASIASIYYQLLSLDQQAEIAQNSIAARESSLETTQALKDAGQVTAVAVKQTEAQIYTARIILVNIENNIDLLENTLCILMGEPPHAIERGQLEGQTIKTELKTGVPALLLENRPDVMAAEYRLINSFELTNVARANFYPRLTLSASAGFQSLELENWFNASSLFSSVAAGLFQPILNGRQIRTNYEVSLSEQEIALLNYKRTLLTAGKEVSDALSNYEAAAEIIEIREKEYAALKTATDYSEELLNNGLANYLEVLTARQSALNSQLNLANARFLRLDAIVELYQALGGGWK